jgi:predicted CXXCH cytochrome family protein
MRKFLPTLLLPLILLCSSCTMKKTAAPVPPGPPVPAYQHYNKPCALCHGIDNPQQGSTLFSPGFDMSGSCLGCHDYKENHHPIDVAPANAADYPLPLFEGRIQCLTCHEIHGGPDRAGTKKLLRGGPFRDRREICFKCHSHEAYASINPHNMLDDQNHIREVNGKPVCLICHSKQPNPAVDFTDDVRFRADVGFLCWRCHAPMPGDFFNKHFLVTPSAKTLKKMNRAKERLYVILPMVPRGRITCSTCHNPHQEGVIQHPAAAKGADARAKLRVPGICTACHEI